MAERHAIGVLHKFAKCIAKTKTVQAQALLATLPESAEQFRLVREIVGQESSCLRDAREMRLKPSLFRGAIAEALYNLNAIVGSPPLSPSVPRNTFESLTARLAAADVDGLDVEDRALLVGRWLAYCSVHEDPGAVDGLMATAPGSVKEGEGLRGFAELFSRCLIQGQTLQVDQLTMRALLAEALYARNTSEPASA